MSDPSKGDAVNAVANITGALKEKRYSKAMETTFKSDYIRSYNNYPLYTVISVIAIVTSLIMALFEGIYYLILVPLIILLDLFLKARRRKIIVDKNKLILKDLKEADTQDPTRIICLHCNKETSSKLEFCLN